MKARHISAIVGIAAAVGAVVFTQSLMATNDHQAVAAAARMLKAVPVEKTAKCLRMQLDFRPDGRVLQGPPMIAMLSTVSGSVRKLKTGEALVTKALFAQRRVKNLPAVGEELTLVGRRGAYKVTIAGYLDWERPVRGYPNAFVSSETAETIDEDWVEWKSPTVEELSPLFKSDAGRNMDRSKPMLLWAAALTALCLLLNSLLLSIESRRREIAVLRMIGMTRGGVVRLVAREAMAMTAAGLVLGVFAALAALWAYVACDTETFPLGMAVGVVGIAASVLAAPLVAMLGTLLALRDALSVKPLEAAANRPPRRRTTGMLIAFACGFGCFVAVEVWGASLTKPFIPSKEWPDAIVSILPGGVSSFDIELLGNLRGVERIHELQPLQVNIDPLEEMTGFKAKAMDDRGRPARGRSYRNALLLASDYLPPFRFAAGEREVALSAIRAGDSCIITEMMARSRKLQLGDKLQLDCGRGLKLALDIVGIVDLNWHMVTSRGLVRGLNRMPSNTDGPVFVSFDTLAACDPRPQEFVHMTHLWLDYKPDFLAEHGVFEAGRIVERAIVEALGGAYREDKDGEIRGNTVRLHARDEIADGTLAHSNDLVGAMARVPYIFLVVISLGFVAMLVSSAESRRREFAALRAVGATQWQISRMLASEALRVGGVAVALGVPLGALAGWLFTSGTRAAMANWGLPACFDIPLALIAEGAVGAIAIALLVAVPVSVGIIRRVCRR